MEAKIVAATLTALAVVFAGMNSTADLEEGLPEDGSILKDLNPSFDLIDELNDNPEPDNPVEINLELSETQDLDFESEKVTADGLKRLKDINSEEDINLVKFDGELKTGNDSRLQGTAEGFETSGIDVNSSTSVDKEITGPVEVEGLDREAFEFGADEIELKSGDGSDIDQSNAIVEISSFSGNMTYTPDNVLEFSGEVDEVSSGSTSFGN